MKVRQLLVLLITLLSFQAINAQWSCPSKMNAHLKPMWDDGPLSWSAEIEAGGGALGDRAIMNAMTFGALELYLDNIEVYLEGGVKHWSLWENDSHLNNTMKGIREAYIGLTPFNSSLRVGVQSLQLNDQFIFNERMLGASFLHQSNGLSIQVAAGTVSNRIARNGVFCSKCYLYDIVQDRPQVIIAPDFMEAFFATTVISLNPSTYKKSKSTKPSNDEFQSFDEFNSADEFATNDEFSPNTFSSQSSKEPLFTIDDYGVIIYSELGPYYDNYGLWAGAFTNLQLPLKIDYKLEVLFQEKQDNRGVFIINTLDKSFSSSLGFTDLSASFYYFETIDDQALAMLSYSNLFLGEVLRFDAIEMPLLSIYAKHRFKGKGMSLKLQYASNIGQDRMSELDLQFNKNLNKHFHLIATAGLLSGDAVQDYPYLARLELRYTF